MRNVVKEPLLPTTEMTAAGPPKIAVEQLGKQFSDSVKSHERPIDHRDWALRDINFTVSDGEFIALVGESGCGKTTLLRLIAGLETPTTGGVRLDREVVHGPSREVGFVFQRPVLLPWRTVLDNVLLPIELHRQSPQKAQRQALDLLRLLGLQDFTGHRPQHLSGGMQQRVALARTLMLNPSVLLMDEPFGALDAITREQLNLELLRMWRQGRQTVVFITHDIAEAVFLADRVLVMSRRPGTIASAYTIPLPRPRTLDMRFEPDFAGLCRDIHHAMGLMRDDQRE